MSGSSCLRVGSRRYQLSFADAWIAATAKLQGATLVHEDPEIEALGAELDQRILPFKRRQR